MDARLASFDGEVYRGRGRGPGSVGLGLRALCKAIEKSVFLAPEEGRMRAVPDETISTKIAERT
ncbi:hypothetical protein ABI_27850 [Asticcacaulis biprosthecium C19]|uniref:Uncharacterized protein n=1 Tax=Asticcacaulis biprosthecium C19 TaxID=715226 RepID=F4QMC9_9CAUL|nr:hypothetical protein ABI_27850 [Asticcacaulis biprosthecium C19]